MGLALLAAACAEPPPAGHIDDRAGLFDAAGRARLELFHELLLADHDIDYQVVTTRDPAALERQAVTLFDARRVGARSSAGRGLLLLVNPAQDRLRLEVSTALEGVFVDAFVAYLEQRQMVPFFERGRLAEGILAATEMIVTRAQNAARNAGFAAEAWAAGTGGAGASAAARIGRSDGAPDWRGPPGVMPDADSPSAVVTAYLAAMGARNANPDLPLYTRATRALLATWVVTAAQMDNVVKAYRECRAEAPHVSAGLAVLRYPPGQRACAPWFLRREETRWRLDLAAMQQAIRFGRDNTWHFAAGLEHPYAFAFDDWRFDAHGYPRHQ